MKRNSLFLLILICSSIYFIATSSSNGRATAANAGNTGAPGESQVCGNCHNGGAYGMVNLSIQVFIQGTNTPVTAYIPGNTYDVRVTVQNSTGNPAGYGFQLTCLTTPGNSPLAGYTNLASNVKQKTVLVGAVAGRTYVEHNGVLPNNQFNFSWTAPAAGTGSVRMYSAGNAVNGTGGTGSDNGGSTSLTLTEAQQLSIASTSTNPSCAGGSNGTISINITSGNAPYSYLWNDGNNQEDRNNLSAGNYSVAITDNAGQVQNLSFEIEDPQAIEAQFAFNDAAFFGGTGSFSILGISGGNPPYTTSLSPQADIDQLPVGDYVLTVTDESNCTNSFEFTISSPADLEVESNVQDISCAGAADGEISPEISGGVPPYGWQWADGDFNLSRDFLSAGDYSLTITDAVGYSKEFSFTITEPQPLSVETALVPISCFGGLAQITLTATGGSGVYTGDGIFEVPAGEFEALIFDSNNCSDAVQLTIEQPEQIVVDYLTQPISCTGETGMISFTVSGGVEPFIQTFSDESISSPGLYNFEFIDANNCTSIIDVNVPAIDGFEINSVIENIACFNDCDGEIVLSVTGAQGVASFAWSDGATSQERFDLCPGTYLVSVIDENNCTITSSYTITQPEQLVLGNFQIIQSTATGVEINIPVSGGTEPYSYAWTTGESSSNALIPYNENHNVTVTDANGCEVTNDANFFFLNLEETSLAAPKIYPNPATEFITIENVAVSSTVQIYDMTGRMILNEIVTSSQIQLDINTLDQGNYIVRIKSENIEYTYRMNVR